MKREPDFASILREHGSKATPGRIALLSALWGESKPVTVAHLNRKLSMLDEATLYRSLEALVSSGVVRHIDFRHGHAHYELNVLREHHHHIVCTDCGAVEDAPCSINFRPRKRSRFKVVTDHAVEFFGVCKRCSLG